MASQAAWDEWAERPDVHSYRFNDDEDEWEDITPFYDDPTLSDDDWDDEGWLEQMDEEGWND